MKAALLLLLSSLAGFGSAFVVMPPPPPPSPRFFTTTAIKTHHLNEVDEMCIENVAQMCLDMECDVEEYEALVNSLEEQQKYHKEQVALTEQLLGQLKGHQVHGSNSVSTNDTEKVLAA